MAQKTVGYVELEWTCKRCGTANPGTQKTCSNCGAPMEGQDQFEMPDQQKLISDQDKIAAAQLGPDVHCPYCGARNPAGTVQCGQCGGDLKDAQKREAGRVLGAFSDKPAPEVKCPACGTANPADAARCQNCGGSLAATPAKPPAAAPQPAAPVKPILKGQKLLLAIAGAVFLAICCIGVVAFLVLGGRTHDVTASVQSVSWERVILVEELGPVEREAWRDQIPSSAQVGSCTRQLRQTQSEPIPGAEEVCGTPYTVDQGSGVGKVVQDCEYRVYDDRCKYTVEEWREVDQVVAQGNDLEPLWPDLALKSGQREGTRKETYTVTFNAGSETYNYRLQNSADFVDYSIGSQWLLKVNTFGNITQVIPK